MTDRHDLPWPSQDDDDDFPSWNLHEILTVLAFSAGYVLLAILAWWLAQ